VIRRLRALLVKELVEIAGNRVTLGTLVAVPLLMTCLALGNLYATSHLGATADESSEPLPAFIAAACVGLDERECVQAYTGSIFQLVFLLLPMVIPSAIAAYAVVGEKTARTLEPLLATPLSTAELLAAKVVSSLAPGLLATWAAWAAFLVGAWEVTSPGVFHAILAPHWILAMGALAPLLGIGSVAATVLVSSRVSDPRTAQQLSGLLVLPMIGVLFGQISGAILLSPALVGAACVAVAGVDAIVLWLAVATFEREAVLTRWK
jgi:ABC-2 type transport system permease protein